MSLLTPERVPVKVYRWDDAGAPVLDKRSNCMATIFKACLDTGYGTKEGAGWTTAFESTGVKVLRPEVGPHTDFYLRLSADTGTEMIAQVYLNMTDANTGDLKLQCDTPFKYAKGESSGRWLLIASARSVWFFCEQKYRGDADKTGLYFFAGDVGGSGLHDRPVYIQHTGGDNNSNHSNMFGRLDYSEQPFKRPISYLYGKAISPVDNSVETTDLLSMGDGYIGVTTDDSFTGAILPVGGLVHYMPGLFVPLSVGLASNFTSKTTTYGQDVLNLVVFAASDNNDNNVCIATDYWSY